MRGLAFVSLSASRVSSGDSLLFFGVYENLLPGMRRNKGISGNASGQVPPGIVVSSAGALWVRGRGWFYGDTGPEQDRISTDKGLALSQLVYIWCCGSDFR